MRSRYRLVLVAFSCALLGALWVVRGNPTAPVQGPDGLRPTVFAIHDARVVTEPGKVLPKATVVVRDGLIESVGADVAVPADALPIDGKGLTVYAGFIDALSHWGYDPALRRSEGGSPEPIDLATESLATTKADNRKGVTPEFAVAAALRQENDPADAWRHLGFTAHLVAPEGGILAGQSALVSLSGAGPREAVLRTPVASHAVFQIGGAEYPRVLMGMVAHARQTLLDAGHYQRTWATYEKNGQAGKRPLLDPALAALGPLLDGKTPFAIEGDSRDGIQRALSFAEEFHLKPILVGGRHAWKLADRLAEKKAPVILRLNFTEPLPDREPLPKRAEEDRQARLKEEVHNAAVLHEKGVAFAFSGTGFDKPEKFRENLRKVIASGLSADAALAALTVDAAKILGAERQLGTVTAGKAAHLVVTDGDFQDEKTQVRFVFADGVRFEYGKPKEAKKEEPKKEEPKKEEPKKPDEKKPEEAKPTDKQTATELDADRKPQLHTSGNVLLRGATLLTVAQGTKVKTDLLVMGGKIKEIGAGLKAPEGVAVIDADGMFVMPGVIDTHCHFAISGGVNEFSLSVVPEVRVRDVVDSEDVEIYRALAGGVTTARLLHGSANVIGGQDAVIKLKYGKGAEELLLADAPRGVKFALGENVKRTDGRFPNSRLGVEAVLIRAFTEAQAYQREWDAYKKALELYVQNPGPLAPMEPRRDLRLEALADVLKGDLKVHCHCYRADEILMLLKTADHFGFKIKSLQHVLEGYKIAPEIADHGASCSTFADWWAYKIEAFDAIPFNTALLTEAGASVCIKSDSNELVRHLFQEAAKGMKYGNLSEEDALKTITLNGAKQLGLDKRLGSLEVGKDADLAIFNGHPFNGYSRVEMTLIDGEVYFQRSEKLTAYEPAKAGPVKAPREFKPTPTNPDGNYLIENATVHPVSGKTIPKGTVLIQKGKIALVLDLEQPVGFVTPAGTTHVDGAGLHLYPGMIDGGTVLGLTELGSARETHDFAEGGDFQPDLRASVAINPDSELIPVTRANGVLSVVTRPTGAVVAGQGALIDLAGWVPKEMVVVDPIALAVDFPAPFPVHTGDPTMPMVGRAIAKKAREEKIRRLKELFAQAVAYDEAGKRSSSSRAVNPRLEALAPYARGLKPVLIQANRKADILEALKFADELKLKIIISGGLEAWRVTDELKKHDVPVVVGPVMNMPQENFDPYDSPYACAARLHEAGVRFCIHSSGGSNTRNLPYEAAMAVAHGLPPEEALRAVTVYPAQILGVADQLGSIEVGKRANLVLTDGDILQPTTHVLGLFIDGRPLEPVSKQTRLYERYRERLRAVKAGQAPLGTK